LMEWIGLALPLAVFVVAFGLLYRREQRLQRPASEQRRRARLHLLFSVASFALIVLAAALEFWPLLLAAVFLLVLGLVKAFR
jgi:hypothetical protein